MYSPGSLSVADVCAFPFSMGGSGLLNLTVPDPRYLLHVTLRPDRPPRAPSLALGNPSSVTQTSSATPFNAVALSTVDVPAGPTPGAPPGSNLKTGGVFA